MQAYATDELGCHAGLALAGDTRSVRQHHATIAEESTVPSPAEKAAATRKRRAAAKKAATTKKRKAAARKAADTKKRRSAAKKAATTRKRRAAARKAAETRAKSR